MAVTLFVPFRDYISQMWPSQLFDPPSFDFLDNVWIEPVDISSNGGLTVHTALLFETELSLSIPGLDAVELVFAPSGSYTAFAFEFETKPTPRLSIVDTPIALRFNKKFFKPARRAQAADGSGTGVFEVDPDADFVDITLGKVTLSVDLNGNFKVDGVVSISLPPSFIGDTGVVVEAQEIRLYLDANSPPPGQPAGWRGVHIQTVALYLPGELSGTIGNLKLTDAYIGNGGFTGSIEDTWTPPLSAHLFDMDFALAHAKIAFVQNTLTAAGITGKITVPFFDEPVDVDIGLTLDGSFTVALNSAGGLFTLEKQDLLRFQLDGMAFERKDSVFAVHLSGEITPLIAQNQIQWPTFHLNDLTIDSRGNVHLDGGWIDLSQQKPLDFYGFQFAITKLGFGQSDDGGRWVGFSGGIKLVEGIPAGVSVEGLRVTWYTDGRPVAVSMNGVGVEFTVPNTVAFKGAVSYNTIHENGHTIQRFDGSISLNIVTIDLQIEAVLVFGSDTGPDGRYTFFAIYTGIELPSGIPLGQTSLAIYGFAGLFAYQMEPNKGKPRPDEMWYDNEDGSPGWYKRGQMGVTDLKTKWDPHRDSVALGAGITLGTLMDNGMSFHGKFLLAIVFPGPIIMIEGRGDLLKKRADANGKQTTTSEPLFRTIAILDFRLGTVTLGLSVWYKYDDKGGLIDMTGSAEAFFDFNHPSAWHVYVGRETPEQYRVHAYIFKKLFEANSFLMLDRISVRTGAWIGVKFGWSFGPLKVALEASLEGRAELNFTPGQFHGFIVVRGSLVLSAFGFGVTASIDAGAAAEVFKPFHIVLHLTGELKLPWPLPSFKHNFVKEWGPYPEPPPLPAILKEIAVEHNLVAITWPLIGELSLLAPTIDDGQGYIDEARLSASQALLNAPAPAAAPVIPLDARPHLTFGRRMNDDALVGVNVQPGDGVWERFGDPVADKGPVRVRFGLESMGLEKWVGGATYWSPVASTSGTPKKLYGAWAPALGPNEGPAQTKLMLWSKNPFDYTRHGGSSWNEAFSGANPTYPCVPPAPERKVCCDFSGLHTGDVVASPWQCPDHPEITLSWPPSGDPVVTNLSQPVDGLNRALCFPGSIAAPGGVVPNEVTLSLPPGVPVRQVSFTPPDRPDHHARRCLYFEARPRGTGPVTEEGIYFFTNGAPGSQIASLGPGGPMGVAVGNELRLDLPRPCTQAEVTLWTQNFNPASPVSVDGYCRSGKRVSARMSGPGTETLRLRAPDLIRLVIRSQGETLLLQLCLESVLIDAVGQDGGGGIYPASIRDNGEVVIVGGNIESVKIHGEAEICIVQVCALLPPDPTEVARRDAMAQHFQDELARWYGEDDLLEPDTIYRLKIVTHLKAEGVDELAGYAKEIKDIVQYAYFRTQGTPGLAELSFPAGSPSPLLYEAGKISVKSNSDQVTGNGTAWQAELVGAFLQVASEARGYRVARRVSDTQLVLGEAYSGPDQTDVTYRIGGFRNPLDDLIPYVRQTIPPTVPPPGQPPLLPRPVYRAYDTGVEFNVNYVDLMYQMRRRGLGLYLFDNNNRPARDAAGRLIVLANHWGSQEDLTLTEGDLLYIRQVNANSCAVLDAQQIVRNKTLTSSDASLILNADTVYEGRLIPLLLEEDFSAGLAAWRVVDQGDRMAPSNWKTRASLSGSSAVANGNLVTLQNTNADFTTVDVTADILFLEADTARRSRLYRILKLEIVDNSTRRLTLDTTPALSGTSSWRIPMASVEQRSSINGGTLDGRDPAKPGTLLLARDISTSDCRISVSLRSWQDGALGVVFRVQDDTHYYRFSMSREHRYRRLVRVRDNEVRILAEDYFVFETNRDYLVTVEAVGDLLRIYLDGDLVFNAQDNALASGGVGLYCWDNPGARFSDARLDDFRPDAPVVYRYPFTTSQFANFYHHLHSFQDETWGKAFTSAELPDRALQGALSKASELAQPPSDDETRAYDTLARLVLGSQVDQNPAEMQVTRVYQNGQPVGWLMQSPEPVDWRRSALEISSTSRSSLPSIPPGDVKLTGVGFSAAQPAAEWVDLLARGPVDLDGYRIEQLHFPGAQPETGEGEILLVDSFDGSLLGLLFEETFGPNALDRYTLLDEEPPGGTHDWRVANGRIEQRRRYLGGQPGTEAQPTRPGTIALFNAGSFGNARIRAVLHSQSSFDIGLVFRAQDMNNYYRFSVSRNVTIQPDPFRRLVKKVNGVVQVLWQDTTLTQTANPSTLVIETFGDHLIGYLNDELLFSLRDSGFASGQVGFYCWNNDQAFFEGLQVEALEADPVLWQPVFQSLDEVEVVEAPNSTSGPADWQVQGGELVQLAPVVGLEGALEALPGAAYDVAAGPDGTLAVVGVDGSGDGYYVYLWRGANWQGVGSDALRITASPNCTLAWVSASGKAYGWRQGQTTPLPFSGIDLAYDPNGGLWLVSDQPAPGGFELYRWDGANLDPAGIGALRVTATPNGTVWIVDETNRIFYSQNGGWQQAPGAARDIGAGADGSVWIISNTPAGIDCGIQRWNGQDWEDMYGSGSTSPWGGMGCPS